MTRLIVYNIEYCEGLNGSFSNYMKFWKAFYPPKKLDEKIVKELKKFEPDILALVEVDIGSFRNKNKDEVKYFKKKLGMSSFVEAVKYPTKGIFKNFYNIPILSKQANAILAKSIIYDIKYHYLSYGVKRLVIEAKINSPKQVTLYLAHLALGKATRKKQFDELANIINSTSGNIILMGDFNTFSGTDELKDFLKKTNLNFSVKNMPIPTHPAFKPKRELDYVLSSKNIKINSYETLNFEYSDHLPLMVDFEIK